MSRFPRSQRILFTADNGVCVEMYRPLAARLARDERFVLRHAAYLRHRRESFAGTDDAAAWLRTLGLPGRVLHYRTARWLPFDACVTPSFADRLDPRNARLRIQIFHGVSFKNYCIKEKALRYDRLYLPGEYHRRRYVEAGLFEEGDPRLKVIGLPKLDRLVDGTYRRDDVLRELGLDPSLETVLFAPTGDHGNALSFHGERLLETLRRLPLNVVVKPHDHSKRDENGVDWHARLRALEDDRFKAVLRSDIVPLLAAADLLITDASSVAFEYALRDRPIVFLDVPLILQGPRAHRFDLGTWGRRAGHVVENPAALLDEVPRLLESPGDKGELRRALARDVFHEPGSATTRALAALYEDLGVEPDPAVLAPDAAPSEEPPAAPPRRPTPRVRRPRPTRTLVAGAVGIAAVASLIGWLEPAAADVRAVAETEAGAHGDDQPDDLCIVVDPLDPSSSRLIVADERAGLSVYDLEGRLTQRLEIGPQLHVDTRVVDGPTGEPTTLIASSSGTDHTITLHELDPETRRLVRVSSPPLRPGVDVRGLCLHRRSEDGSLHLFAVGHHPDGDHRMEQWELSRPNDGIRPRFVRELRIGGPAEGCVADDELGFVFVAEEGVGIWKYATDPSDGTPRRLIDRTGLAGHLRGDVEGLALLRTGPGQGYLVASSQGSDDLVVYRRGVDHGYLGRFELVAGGGVDGVSNTEGIDGVGADLGGVFHRGLLVAHDASDDRARTNVKLVAWSSVADALSLPW